MQLMYSSLVSRQVVQRAREEDLNRVISYEVAFIRNSAGRVVTDVRTCKPSNTSVCTFKQSVISSHTVPRSAVNHAQYLAGLTNSGGNTAGHCVMITEKGPLAAVPLTPVAWCTEAIQYRAPAGALHGGQGAERRRHCLEPQRPQHPVHPPAR